MSGTTNCELCNDPLVGGHDRVGGLALCRPCYLGDVRRVAVARDWTLWSDHVEFSRHEYDESDMCYRTTVRITMPCEPGLELKCVRRTWWTGLLGLVRSRARSQDALFETHTRVWTPHPPRVEALLRAPGVESSLMDNLGNYLASHVLLRHGQLEVHYVADDPHTEGEIVARACVLAHHLERHATSQAFGATPSRIPSGRG